MVNIKKYSKILTDYLDKAGIKNPLVFLKKTNLDQDSFEFEIYGDFDDQHFEGEVIFRKHDLWEYKATGFAMKSRIPHLYMLKYAPVSIEGFDALSGAFIRFDEKYIQSEEGE